MSYLLDKKNKQKKLIKLAGLVVVLLILFYFRSGVFNKLSYAGHTILRPVLVLGGNFRGKLSELKIFFVSKNSLYQENLNLKSQIDMSSADRANYDSVVAENLDLKAILGRKETQNPKANMILAAILTKPNQSPYDTLVIDIGTELGIKTGDMVFAFGAVPIGRVAEVYKLSAKVILFSSSGEKTDVIISGKDTFMQITGRGGGNFEMILPRDFTVLKGDQVVLPGIIPYVVGVIQTTISDPRDPSQKALLTTPVNIQELKFVEVEI